MVIQPLEWQDATDKGYSQANCALGQYQVSWLGEFECWQCARPHKAGLDWKDNFSRHPCRDEAKAAAQSDFVERISAALSVPAAAAQTANCCVCGRIIDTREEEDGGDKFGAELPDRRWTCSFECNDVAIGEQPAEAVVGEPVEWQRYVENFGWQRVNDEDLPHYRDKGERLRALYAAPSAPDGWQPDASQQWRLDRIGEEIAAGRKQNALTYLSCVFAEISQRQKAIDKVLAAEADFRSNMPADWQGDPLSDAVAELRKALGGKP